MNTVRKYAYPLCEGGVLALWLILASEVCPEAGVSTAIMLAGIWVCVRAGAHILDVNSRAEKRVLLGAMALLGALLIVNIDFFLSHPGAREGQPYLANFDASVYWGHIRGGIENGLLCSSNYANYAMLMTPLAIAGGFRAVLGFNALCIMLTICLSGRIARECCGQDGGAKVSAATMLMLTFAFNFLTLGTVLLKDATVGMAFSAVAAALLILRKSENLKTWPMLGAVAASILSIWVRPLSGAMIIAMIVMLAPWKRIARGEARPTAIFFAALTVLCGLWLVAVTYLMPILAVIVQNNLNSVPSQVFAASPRGSSLMPLIDSYPAMPMWEKLALLPLSMGLQLLLPLPWTFLRHFDYGPTMMLSHFGIPFYLEAGLVMFFFLFALRKAPRQLVLTAGTGLVFYALTAYLYGGTVSRYAQMMLPLLMPAAGWVAVNCRRERRLMLWMGVYILLLILVLGAGMYFYNLHPSGNDLRC